MRPLQPIISTILVLKRENMLARTQIIGLFLLMMIFSACTTSATPQGDNNSDSSPSVNILDDVPRLRETYTWSNIFTDSAIRVDYPSGWFVEGRGDQLLMSSIDSEDLESDSDALLINVLPAEGDMLLEGIDTTPESLLELSFLETLGDVDNITTTTVNERPAAYTSGEFDGNRSIIYAIQFDEGFFIVMIAIKAGEFTENEEELIINIIESVGYEVGILPSNE